MEEIEFICLANSRKHGGKCVAGIRTDGKGWIRLVSFWGDGVLQPAQTVLPGAGVAQALDHVRAAFRFARRAPHQPENWVLADAPWQLVSRPAKDHAVPLLRAHIAKGPALFGNTEDRIAYAALQIAPADASLALAFVNFIEWQIVEANGKRRARVRFVVGTQVYDLGLTDPFWEARIAKLPPGRYAKETAGLKRDDRLLLTISLGEPFRDGCCYKLVAGIIPVPQSWLALF